LVGNCRRTFLTVPRSPKPLYGRRACVDVAPQKRLRGAGAYTPMTEYDLQTDKSRPHRDERILRDLYHNHHLTLAEVADVLDCSAGAVQRWMEKHGVERRGPSERNVDPRLLDEKWVRKEYVERGKSITEIHEEHGPSRMAIYRALERFNIETHSRGYHVEKDHPSIRQHIDGYLICYAHYNGGEKQEQDRVRLHRLLAVAEYGYDAVADTEVHHKNNIPWDNRPENIELLSKADHAKHHLDERGGLQPWQG